MPRRKKNYERLGRQSFAFRLEQYYAKRYRIKKPKLPNYCREHKVEFETKCPVCEVAKTRLEEMERKRMEFTRTIEKHVIEGDEYYSISDFCLIVNKSRMRINQLINEGNKERKLKCLRLGPRTYIPVKELSEYPWFTGGRSNLRYHYTEEGAIVYESKRINFDQ